MKNNGISRLPWYQSQFAMKQTEIAGWVCTVEMGKMKPWAWVFWEGYAQVLVEHSREDGKKNESSGSRRLHLYTKKEVVTEDFIYDHLAGTTIGLGSGVVAEDR